MDQGRTGIYLKAGKKGETISAPVGAAIAKLCRRDGAGSCERNGMVLTRGKFLERILGRYG
jgi:hypothetical protein